MGEQQTRALFHLTPRSQTREPRQSSGLTAAALAGGRVGVAKAAGARRARHADLDAVGLVGHVAHARLDVGVDLGRRLDERLSATGTRSATGDKAPCKSKKRSAAYVFHVGGGLGRGLQEDEPVLLGKLLALLEAHGSAVLQIALVADQHDDHVRVGVLTRLFQPPREVVERLAPCDVVHQQRAGRAAVVRARDGAERLLAGLHGSVP